VFLGFDRKHSPGLGLGLGLGPATYYMLIYDFTDKLVGGDIPRYLTDKLVGGDIPRYLTDKLVGGDTTDQFISEIIYQHIIRCRA
jgi:hypothetical protein